ncbi:exodeoxyribonuclease VII small subunit [Halorhodospira halochloris]|uniref:Exodeoxyribonuclease 7 small subunit n=1 Tax=Halorhodospira halochloris TaxID=1052 RepID=A0A0X8XAC7_HALHR|nr:exodeoxyribonuclease VII small subunit [Halorhodospira halochloris]MBK1652180.1 exodeoxyribonuclease VII small subunit [Halorhodospira halochloris]MCG5547809.1 exodeoxyribonuclease VII small subunit [Halorhodospira halochloris]BAU58401.1 exodeoxyribonuclease VII small subunit [Halorhodospira halochloris]
MNQHPDSEPSNQSSEQAKPAAEQDPQDLTEFEKSMAELEQLVERMERGELKLEEALRDFERGIQLTRHCQKALSAAEQKVEILLENSEDADVGQFRPNDD